MWKWFAIIATGTAVGYGAVHFALSGGPDTESQTQQPIASESASQPAEPEMLPQVVEVIETDSLLDPQPTPPSGIPFDPTEPLEPQAKEAASATTAPMPRLAN